MAWLKAVTRTHSSSSPSSSSLYSSRRCRCRCPPRIAHCALLKKGKADDEKDFDEFVTKHSNARASIGYDETTHVRGLFASREIKAKEELFHVSLAKEDERVFIDNNENEDDDWSASLAKQILMKRRRSTTSDDDDEKKELKTAYANALPKEMIGIANKCCFYDDNKMNKNKNSDRRTRYELVCKFFEATGDRDAKEELMKYEKQVSSRSRRHGEEEEEEKYGWALSQVFSRTFRIEDARGRRAPRRVMIPIVDLLNHSSVEEEVNVTWRVKEDLSAFIVEAKRNVGKDEELILSYGERNDQHFLLFYGFLPSMNPCNSVMVWENVDECLNWYQNLCGADENDTKWDAMKYKCKRALGLLKKKDEGDFIDDDNDERRRFILSPNAKVDNTTLLVLNEISGDNDMAIAAVRVRAEEILSQRFASDDDANIERIFKHLLEETQMDESDIELLRAYRNRKRDILREII